MSAATQASGSAGQYRWVHGTNPWQGASMVLSAALPAETERPVVARTRSLDAAITLYERGHWAPAYTMLEQLADAGDALASKLALLMLRYGAPLYGTRFIATPKQIALWARQVLGATKWN